MAGGWKNHGHPLLIFVFCAEISPDSQNLLIWWTVDVEIFKVFTILCWGTFWNWWTFVCLYFWATLPLFLKNIQPRYSSHAKCSPSWFSVLPPTFPTIVAPTFETCCCHEIENEVRVLSSNIWEYKYLQWIKFGFMMFEVCWILCLHFIQYPFVCIKHNLWNNLLISIPLPPAQSTTPSLLGFWYLLFHMIPFEVVFVVNAGRCQNQSITNQI